MVAMFVNGSGQNIFSSLWRGSSIYASYQVSLHLAEGVSEKKIKMWKVNGRQTTDAKWWQKLTLPLARWAKKVEATKGVTRRRKSKMDIQYNDQKMYNRNPHSFLKSKKHGISYLQHWWVKDIKYFFLLFKIFITSFSRHGGLLIMDILNCLIITTSSHPKWED